LAFKVATLAAGHQSIDVILQAENRTAAVADLVGSNALERAQTVMKTVGQVRKPSAFDTDQLAVEPDPRRQVLCR
jgi:hypothetical protein